MLRDYLLGISTILLAFSCQSTSPQDESSGDPLEAANTDLSPSELWSPEQRQANASYYYLLAEDRRMAQDHKTTFMANSL